MAPDEVSPESYPRIRWKWKLQWRVESGEGESVSVVERYSTGTERNVDEMEGQIERLEHKNGHPHQKFDEASDKCRG
ncbi:unnamed protein product [Sphenostylis stenocarpa]|uniref:Uncharacterized protein n=1 Tax=Sphenostylis stenocarpa TaxID=92480 RepID=A0AA86VE21_9FABA|nr:unnamed protein product [Sphenostylis stenocarpa]